MAGIRQRDESPELAAVRPPRAHAARGRRHGPRRSRSASARVVSSAKRKQLLAGYGAVTTGSLPLGLTVVSVAPSKAKHLLAHLRASHDVATATPDEVRGIAGDATNSAVARQWALQRIGWQSAYRSATHKRNVNVAILDTGVDTSLSDLGSRVVGGYSRVRRLDADERSERTRHVDDEHRARGRPVREGHAGAGARRARARKGQRHHQGSRVGREPPRERHPHELRRHRLQPRAPARDRLRVVEGRGRRRGDRQPRLEQRRRIRPATRRSSACPRPIALDQSLVGQQLRCGHVPRRARCRHRHGHARRRDDDGHRHIGVGRARRGRRCLVARQRQEGDELDRDRTTCAERAQGGHEAADRQRPSRPRAGTDRSEDAEVVPSGVAGRASGGPFVGPYQAAIASPGPVAIGSPELRKQRDHHADHHVRRGRSGRQHDLHRRLDEHRHRRDVDRDRQPGDARDATRRTRSTRPA